MTDNKNVGLGVRFGEEIWESTVAGRTWVETSIVTAKETKYKQQSVMGVGGRLRIKTEDRQLAQERCRDPRGDVFTNGTLIRLDADQQQDALTASPSARSDEELKKIFDYKQVGRFQNAVKELSEVAVRRMVSLVEEVDATASQTRFLDEHIKENFAVKQNPLDPDKNYKVADFMSTQVVSSKVTF